VRNPVDLPEGPRRARRAGSEVRSATCASGSQTPSASTASPQSRWRSSLIPPRVRSSTGQPIVYSTRRLYASTCDNDHPGPSAKHGGDKQGHEQRLAR